MTGPTPAFRSASTGFTLIEVMIALVVLSIGILAMARLFPLASGSQVSSKMQSTAGQYADEQFEALRGIAKTSLALTPGRHPSTGFDTLGTGAWRRYYVVTQMPAPLDSLLKLEVTVKWNSSEPESVRMSGYLMP